MSKATQRAWYLRNRDRILERKRREYVPVAVPKRRRNGTGTGVRVCACGCGRSFTYKLCHDQRRTRKYASTRCAGIAKRQTPTPCEVCGIIRYRKYPRKYRYCSRACGGIGRSADAARRGKRTRILNCPVCGVEKVIPRSSRRKYCSCKCSRARGPVRRCRSDGYVVLAVERLPSEDKALAQQMVRGRYISEHRFVVAKAFGRPLTRKEHVHHDNGVPNDNRLVNLLPMSPADHKKEHWRVVKELSFYRREVEHLRRLCGASLNG